MSEKSKPSTWKLVASLGCIAVFGGVAIGTTYSLFTSSKNINTHLTIAGSDSIKATLYLKELKQDVLNDDGLIEEQSMLDTIKKEDGSVIVPDENTGLVDLTDYKGNIFETVKLVPTMKGSATFVLMNTGEVAFNYSVSVMKSFFKKDGTTVDEELEKQIVFTAPDGTQEEALKKGGKKEINISYEFKDDKKNNAVQESTFAANLTFNLSSVSRAE